MPSRSTRLRRTALAAVTVVAIGVGVAFWLTRDADDGGADGRAPEAATTTEAPGPSTEDLATLGPERTGGVPVPTEPPSDVATDAPVEAVDPTPPSSSAPTRVDAEVVLTFAGWEPSTSAMEAGGYVVGPLGDDGTCTLTLTNGGDARSASAEAISDATTLSCGTLQIPGDGLTPGTWEAVLSYESDRAGGESAPMEVQVP